MEQSYLNVWKEHNNTMDGVRFSKDELSNSMNQIVRSKLQTKMSFKRRLNGSKSKIMIETFLDNFKIRFIQKIKS